MDTKERKALSIVLNETKNNLFTLNDEIVKTNERYENMLIELMTNGVLNDIIHTIRTRNIEGLISASFVLLDGVSENIIKILNRMGFLVLMSREEGTSVISIDWYENGLDEETRKKLNEYSIIIKEPDNYKTPLVNSLRKLNPLYDEYHKKLVTVNTQE